MSKSHLALVGSALTSALNTLNEKATDDSDSQLWKVGVPEGQPRVLSKTFIFADFRAAFRFMALCSTYIDEVDHHPHWSNVYRRVEVMLTTHDVGDISQKDVDLALAMDRFEQQIKVS